MVYGFGGGVGFWIFNMDLLSVCCILYIFDLFGFGWSLRLVFLRDLEGVEDEFVILIEIWWEIMGIFSMIFLGYSLGGFLVIFYLIKYFDRVKYFILVDLWGFFFWLINFSEICVFLVWVKVVVFVLGCFNLLVVFWVVGFWGFGLV